MRVNFGCGDRYAAGWVNVDLPQTPHRKDVGRDVRQPLPQQWRGMITRAYVGHMLEHLYVDEVIVFLQRLRATMHSSGELLVVGPDVLRARGILAGGQELEIPYDQIRLGADRWEGDVHHWDCHEWAVRRLLLVTGWVDVVGVGIENVADDWPVAVRGPRWQCAVEAHTGGEPFHDLL